MSVSAGGRAASAPFDPLAASISGAPSDSSPAKESNESKKSESKDSEKSKDSKKSKDKDKVDSPNSNAQTTFENAQTGSSGGSTPTGSSNGGQAPQSLAEFDPKLLEKEKIDPSKMVADEKGRVVGVVNDKNEVMGADGSILGVVKDGQVIPASGTGQAQEGSQQTRNSIPDPGGTAGPTTALTGEQLAKAIFAVASSPQMQDLVAQVVEAAIQEALQATGDPRAGTPTPTSSGTRDPLASQPGATSNGTGLDPQSAAVDAALSSTSGIPNPYGSTATGANPNTQSGSAQNSQYGSTTSIPNPIETQPGTAATGGMNDAALNGALNNAGATTQPGLNDAALNDALSSSGPSGSSQPAPQNGATW